MLRFPCTMIIVHTAMVALYKSEYVNNVGTVLLSASDLNKQQWNITDITLLEARRYFQTILPPPSFVRALNEKYVDLLFSYFRDAYSAIRTEINDRVTDRLMTTALSDSIGGYLKAWVLPAAKFSFYGGMISEQNFTRLYEFYEEIKLYLKTDGGGWHNSKISLFDVSVLITKPNTTLNNADPCEQFVLFEMTTEGLNIPVPRVRWAGSASILFLPLKNHSIYAMKDTNSSAMLVKYYEMAKYCLEKRFPEKLKYFENRFQVWLVNEILPHLVDDDVYFALGSVLTVMNKTRELFDRDMQYVWAKQPKPSCKRANLFVLSKKMMIITLLILIEAIWCCLALIYTCHARRKKDRGSNVYLFVEPRRPDTKDECFSTQEIFSRRPFGLKDISSTTSKEREAQTDVGIMVVADGSRNSRSKNLQSTTNAMDTITRPAAIVTQSNLNLDANPEIHNKKSSEIINAANSRESKYNHHSKHKYDRPIDRKVKHLKTEQYVGSVNVIETEIKALDLDKANFADSQFSVSSKIVGVSKSNVSINTSDVKMVTKEQSMVTANFQKTDDMSYTPKPWNTSLPITSSTILNTASIEKHEVKNIEPHCKKNPVATSVLSVIPLPTAKTVSFVEHEIKQNILSDNRPETLTVNKSKVSELQIPTVSSVENVKSELPLKETLANRNQKQPEYNTNIWKDDKNTVNTYSRKSNRLSGSETTPRSLESKVRSRHRKEDRDFKFMKISGDVIRKPDDLTNKRAKPSEKKKAHTNSDAEAPIIEPLQDAISTNSSSTRNKSHVTADAQTKTTRLFTRKEIVGKHTGENPYWEITIDEPQKDVYFGIKGTLTVDSKSMRKSKIPKLSVKTIISPRPAANTSNIKTLIPQLKKKAADDLVLNNPERKIKLNTSL